jgi:hypothetical protein
MSFCFLSLWINHRNPDSWFLKQWTLQWLIVFKERRIELSAWIHIFDTFFDVWVAIIFSFFCSTLSVFLWWNPLSSWVKVWVRGAWGQIWPIIGQIWEVLPTVLSLKFYIILELWTTGSDFSFFLIGLQASLRGLLSTIVRRLLVICYLWLMIGQNWGIGWSSQILS